jgi:hypothetical protein
MQCREVEVVLEKEGCVPVPSSARAHLAGCTSCQGLVADLTSIVATAHLFPAEVEPPAHVWASLRNQLEQEGIIKSAAGTRGSWLQGFSALFWARSLAASAVGILILVAVVLQVRRPAPPTIAGNVRDVYDDTSLVLSTDEAQLPNVQLAGSSVVDVSLRQNLDIVDNFIADCERRVREQPEDDLAREYLSGAYQQKAQLLSVMMERGGNGN